MVKRMSSSHVTHDLGARRVLDRSRQSSEVRRIAHFFPTPTSEGGKPVHKNLSRYGRDGFKNRCSEGYVHHTAEWRLCIEHTAYIIGSGTSCHRRTWLGVVCEPVTRIRDASTSASSLVRFGVAPLARARRCQDDGLAREHCFVSVNGFAQCPSERRC